jgi:hypothetical protein
MIVLPPTPTAFDEPPMADAPDGSLARLAAAVAAVAFGLALPVLLVAAARDAMTSPGGAAYTQIQQPADSSVDTFRAKLEYDRLDIRESSAGLDVRIELGNMLDVAGVPYDIVCLLMGRSRPALLAESASLATVNGPRLSHAVEVS